MSDIIDQWCEPYIGQRLINVSFSSTQNFLYIFIYIDIFCPDLFHIRILNEILAVEILMHFRSAL